jgi:hypothetical protein
MPQQRQPVGEASQAALEPVAPEPVPADAIAVPRLQALARLVHDETAHPVHLRLDSPAVGVTRSIPERIEAAVAEELGHDGEGHEAECRARLRPARLDGPAARDDDDQRDPGCPGAEHQP